MEIVQWSANRFIARFKPAGYPAENRLGLRAKEPAGDSPQQYEGEDVKRLMENERSSNENRLIDDPWIAPTGRSGSRRR